MFKVIKGADAQMQEISKGLGFVVDGNTIWSDTEIPYQDVNSFLEEVEMIKHNHRCVRPADINGVSWWLKPADGSHTVIVEDQGYVGIFVNSNN